MAAIDSTDLDGGTVIKLAPDLTFPGSLSTVNPYAQTGSIDASSGLTELLGLTGKWAIYALRINGMTPENVTIKLTVDGEVIWNDTFAKSGGSHSLYGLPSVDGEGTASPFICESDFSLELQTTTDTAVTLSYIVRPIK